MQRADGGSQPALKGEVANVVSRRGYKAAYSSLFITTPQSHFVRQLPVKGRLIVRFTSSHIKPALKGEVANVVSRRGYKTACSSLFVSTPQSATPTAPRKGEPYAAGIT